MIRALDLWLPGYLRSRFHAPRQSRVTDVMIAICDHFEPRHDTDESGAIARVQRWQQEYPRLVRGFLDADGFTPRHSFFYPIEQYDRELLNRITDVCLQTGSEIEVHLHHDNDTARGLTDKLERGKEDLLKHQALCRDHSGHTRFGFIHGNWALAHSHPHGHHCGVVDELAVLKRAGCYADFTLPSAPDRTQTKIVNQIYYASTSAAPKPHDRGVPTRVRSTTSLPRSRATAERMQPGELLLVQGVLGLDWSRRKFGVIPRIENSELSGANPPTPDRLRLWIDACVHVHGRPEWRFIKLHTHGGIPRNMVTLLGEPMRRFYRHLLETARGPNGYRVHFVTAREMTNIIHAAEAGASGDAGACRDYTLLSNLKTQTLPRI